MKTAAGKIYTVRRAGLRATGKGTLPSPWGSPRVLLRVCGHGPRRWTVRSREALQPLGEGQQGTPHQCAFVHVGDGECGGGGSHATKDGTCATVPRMAFAREQIPRSRYHNTLPQEDIEQGAGGLVARERMPLSVRHGEIALLFFPAITQSALSLIQPG